MSQSIHDFHDDPRNAQVRIWINGQLKPRAEATVSVFDSGFVLGDGVWEGLRVVDGEPVFLAAHLDRLVDMMVRITRAQVAADELAIYIDELFEVDSVERALIEAGIAPDPASIRAEFDETLAHVLGEATLTLPKVGYPQLGGKLGRHTEHLGHLLAEMQVLHRAHPGGLRAAPVRHGGGRDAGRDRQHVGGGGPAGPCEPVPRRPARRLAGRAGRRGHRRVGPRGGHRRGRATAEQPITGKATNHAPS